MSALTDHRPRRLNQRHAHLEDARPLSLISSLRQDPETAELQYFWPVGEANYRQ